MIEYKIYSDLNKKYDIEDGFFDMWYNKPDKEKHYKILENSYCSVVAIDTEIEKIVGFITVISDGVLSAYIPLLEVIPKYRNRGIGTELFKKAVEKTKDLYMVDLCCDDDVLKFYEKFEMYKSNSMLIRNYDKI